MSTKSELQDRVSYLERELEKYTSIAAAYRAALGDAKANEILGRHFRRHREREEWRNKVSESCSEILASFRKAGIVKPKP